MGSGKLLSYFLLALLDHQQKRLRLWKKNDVGSSIGDERVASGVAAAAWAGDGHEAIVLRAGGADL
jgi:hypothetical protein